jgi:trimethylguanosine synthase
MTLAQQAEALAEKIRYRYNLTFHYRNCPFGAESQEAWNHRYELFSLFDRGIQTDAVGLYSVTPEKTAEEIARETARLVPTEAIVDAFCGIGGTAIAFAGVFEKVFTIDTDAGRLDMAKHNARLYGRSNITFMQGNFLEQASVFGVPTVFLDPPWGGPAALDKATFKLADFSPEGDVLLATAFKYFSNVILRVPPQFDFTELAGRRYHVQTNLLDGRVISKTIYFHA